MQVGVLLFDLLPALLNRVVVRRIGRQLDDLPPGRLLGEEGCGLGAGMILRPILKEEEGLGGLRQDTREKGHGGGRVEATVLPLIKEVPREVVDQAEAFRAFARATRLYLGCWPRRAQVYVSVPHCGNDAASPNSSRAFRALARRRSGPRRGAPRLPFVCIKMSGDTGGFLKAKAQVLQQLGDGEDVVEDAEAVVNQLLDHGRTPAGAAAPRLDRPLVKAGGESGLLRQGEFGGRPGGFWRGAPWRP